MVFVTKSQTAGQGRYLSPTATPESDLFPLPMFLLPVVVAV